MVYYENQRRLNCTIKMRSPYFWEMEKEGGEGERGEKRIYGYEESL